MPKYPADSKSIGRLGRQVIEAILGSSEKSVGEVRLG